MLEFSDTDKKFELEGEFLKMTTEKTILLILLIYRIKETKIEFAKEMYFDEKAVGNKSGRDKTPIRLLKSPATTARSLKRKPSSKKDPKTKRIKNKMDVI